MVGGERTKDCRFESCQGHFGLRFAPPHAAPRERASFWKLVWAIPGRRNNAPCVGSGIAQALLRFRSPSPRVAFLEKELPVPIDSVAYGIRRWSTEPKIAGSSPARVTLASYSHRRPPPRANALRFGNWLGRSLIAEIVKPCYRRAFHKL